MQPRRNSHLPDNSAGFGTLAHTRRLPRLHRAGPSASLDKSAILTCGMRDGDPPSRYEHRTKRAFFCQERRNGCAATGYTWRGERRASDGVGELITCFDGRGFGTITTGSADPVAPIPLPDDPGNHTSRWTYSPQGDQQSSTVPPIRNNTFLALFSLYRIPPYTNATGYGYDLDGNPTSPLSPRGNTTGYGYDHPGRQITATPPALQLYDGSAALTQSEDTVTSPRLARRVSQQRYGW